MLRGVLAFVLACLMLTLTDVWAESAAARVLEVRPQDGAKAITRTVARARAGDRVRVFPGTYRGEQIRFLRSGTPTQPIVLEAGGPGVVVAGSQAVTGWQRLGGPRPIYRRTAWRHAFHAFDARILQNPYSAEARDLDARFRARNQLFVDGTPLLEVPLRTLLGPGRFFVDAPQRVIDLYLPDGGNPNTRLVEVADTEEPLLTTDGQSHIEIRGITFQHGANPPQEHALVQLAGGESCRLVGCTVQYAAGAGVSVSAGIGHRVEGCRLVRNGQLGLHSTRATDCQLVGGETSYNNTHPGKRYDPGWEAGGMKISRSRGFRVEGHLSRFNVGSGIWFDIDNHHAVITGCTSHNNGVGIHYEISYTALIANNLCFNNYLQGQPVDGPFGQGIYISSSAGCRVFQNTCYGNATRGLEVGGPVRADGAGRRVASYGNHVFNNVIANNQRQNPNAAEIAVHFVGGDALPSITDPFVPLGPNRLDYNVYYRADDRPAFRRSHGRQFATLTSWQASTGQDQHSVWGDPRFVDAARQNFRLKPDSIAVDRGVSLPAVRVDRQGRPRPQGAGYDVGAVESR